MKKMNKRGFLLAEAIVVGVFVLSLFTFLFVNVVPLVGQYEAMEKYDTINGAYNANLIRTMILEDDNSEEILNLGSNPYKIYEREDLCSDKNLDKENYCWKLLGDTYLNVDKIYITWYRTERIKATSLKNDVDFDRAARDYIANLDDYKQPAGATYDNYKRIIVSYNDGTFANIEVKVANTSIPEGGGTSGGTTDEEVSCLITAKGTKGTNNWYTSDVDIHLTTKGSVVEYGLSTEQDVDYNYLQNAELTVDTKGTTFYGFVKDTEGFTATCSITVKRDTTGPINIKIVNPTNGNPTNKPFSLTVEGNDPESGLEYWYYSFDEENWTKYDKPEYDSYEKDKYVTSPFSKERNEDVYIKACNKAGKCTTDHTIINIDITKPMCTLTPSGSKIGSYYTGDVTFTLTSPETMAKYLISSQSLNENSITSYDNKATKVMNTDTNGSIYYGYVVDVAGNTATCASVTVKRDTTAPTTITISNPKANTWTNQDFSVTVTSDDTHSGIDYWYYSYDKTTWYKYDSADYNSYQKKSFTTSPFSAERNQDVYFKVCDKVGKCTISDGSRIKIDKTAPSCTLSGSGTAGNNGWFRSNITVSTVRKDEGTHQSDIHSHNLSTNSSPSYGGTTTATITGDTTGITYYCYVKDNAGNTGYNSETFKKDTVAPYKNGGISGFGYTGYNSSGGALTSWFQSRSCGSSSCSLTACSGQGLAKYWYNSGPVTNSGVFADATSGVASVSPSGSSSGTINCSSAPCYKTTTFYATDYAGNSKEYKVYWTIDYQGRSGSTCKYGTGVGG